MEAPSTETKRTDAELVEQTRAGDLRAFEDLVERHRGAVRRLTARIVGPDDADDVTQDTFLRAFHRLSQFRGDASFRGWLFRIAHNAALNALSRRRDAAVEDTEQAMGAAPRSSARTPAEELEISERRERLAEKLRLIRPHHRAVLVLRDLEGLSYEEIARITDTPLGSVKGRLHRARQELVEVLRANLYDWDLPPA